MAKDRSPEARATGQQAALLARWLPPTSRPAEFFVVKDNSRWMDGPIAQIRRPTAQWRKAAPVQRKYAHSSALAPMVMPLYYREADNTTTAAHCKRTPHMLDSGFSSLLRCCAAPHAYSALTTLLVRLYLFSLSLHPSSLVSWPQAAKVRRLTPPAPPWEMGAAPARAASI